MSAKPGVAPKPGVKVLFASGSDAVNRQTLEHFRSLAPAAELLVVAEFPPAEGEWIRYHIHRSPAENRALIDAKLAGRKIELAALILEPNIPHWPMRKLALQVAPWKMLAFNETGQHFRLRPDNAHVMLRNLLWRAKNWARSRGGEIWETLTDPKELRLSLLYRKAASRGRKLIGERVAVARAASTRVFEPGMSVVIPSRNGKDLLTTCLPRLGPAQVIVVDNGSTDGTVEFLRERFPDVEVEVSAEPLSFSVAVNRGLAWASRSHVCVLNNDMQVEPGFLDELRRAFDTIPNLFCSTAQIFFPEGQRREETGKTILPFERPIEDFPIRCVEPLTNEDQSYVLYGSGGCSMYDAAKLDALGGFDEAYVPAYVEDLDLGVRGWLRGWPSVYVAGARTLHQHRATTSRYYSERQLELALEHNYARFLARAVPDPGWFAALWREAILRWKVREDAEALAFAASLPTPRFEPGGMGFLALVNGDVCVFPGRPKSGKPVVLIASPYVPFPLAHGAAVRIYNLMRNTADEFDLVLVAFAEQLEPVPQELLDICTEVVIVRRAGSHALLSRGRPDTVEEFDTPSFHAALRWTITKWHPVVVQLEFTQMAMYAPDCAPAKTILVEHDITFDLYAQLLSKEEDFETRRQYQLWERFERQAWSQVDRVVVMSDKDRAAVPGSVAILNGVDLDRFQPSPEAPDPRRLLFIGSFAHKPNVLAVEFFLRDVFPLLEDVTLHVIAGKHHERFWDRRHDNVEVEGFVSDVRVAYRRAAVVIAPLVASAGTNIKIMEAMAMGKAIVSTPAGIHGLELVPGRDVLGTESPEAMADAISRLLASDAERSALESQARDTAERTYGWKAIARVQADLYREIDPAVALRRPLD